MKRLQSFSRKISLFSVIKMIQACAFPCISLGHLFLCMVSKGSKEESGITNTEVLSGFRPLQRNQPKKKLIILRSNIPNFTNLTLEMTCQRFQTVILLVALWAVWISLMSFLSKNTKIQFHNSSKRVQKPHSNSS